MSAAETAQRLYRSHHWGLPSQRVIDLGPNGNVYPSDLPQMGELIKVLVETVEGGGLSSTPGDPVEIELPPGTHLAFGTAEPRRLYVVYERPGLGRDVAKALWVKGNPTTSLQEVNNAPAGRWKKYPIERPAARRLQVQVVGWLLEIWYQTEKGKDGPSTYHHVMGEVTNRPPLLCVDREGRLWIAGGNYKVEPRGVVD